VGTKQPFRGDKTKTRLLAALAAAGAATGVFVLLDIPALALAGSAAVVVLSFLARRRCLAGGDEGGYRALFETTGAATVILEADTTIVAANEEFARLAALPREEIEGKKSWTEFVSPEDRERMLGHHRARRADPSGAPTVYEFTFVDSRGQRREIILHIDMIPGTTRSVASLLDVTQRRRAEEMLRDLFENSLDLICLHDLEGRFLAVNKAGADIFGLTQQELLGRKIPDFLLPEFREDFYRQYLPAIEGDGHATGIMAVLNSRGERRILHYRNTLRRETGQEPVVRGIARDVTESWLAEKALRKSEEKYRSIFERAAEGIFQCDRRGRLLGVNPAMARMCGYENPEAMLEEVEDIAADLFTRKDLFARCGEILRTQESIEGFEHKIRRRDGSEIWVAMTLWAVRDKTGSISLYEGIMADISDRVRAEKERRDLEHRLVQAQKLESIGTLAGGIAHDFNNLLMGIQGYTSLMLMGMDPDHPHYERLKGIERQVRSGAELTRQILGFARAGAYDKRPLHLGRLLEETLDIFARTRKDVTVRREIAPDLRRVEADRGQMERVFMNLFVNAGDAMVRGGELTVTATNAAVGDGEAAALDLAPGSYVRITVSDTGAGMDEKTLERIFEPFFTTKAMGRGTGLGLATAWGIVKGHGGHIEAASRPAEGTTFTILLPALGGDGREEGEKEDRRGEPPRGTETILLVDDEEIILGVNRDILETLGYRVIPCRDGREALKALEDQGGRIDLVILDATMPGMTGGETFDEIRRRAPGMKVILSSGWGTEGEAKRIMERGCRHFLPKPFHIETLARKVREVLDEA